jgi:hypothetical protein
MLPCVVWETRQLGIYELLKKDCGCEPLTVTGSPDFTIGSSPLCERAGMPRLQASSIVYPLRDERTKGMAQCGLSHGLEPRGRNHPRQSGGTRLHTRGAAFGPIPQGIADQMGAIMLAYGVTMALAARERYGVG